MILLAEPLIERIVVLDHRLPVELAAVVSRRVSRHGRLSPGAISRRRKSELDVLLAWVERVRTGGECQFGAGCLYPAATSGNPPNRRSREAKS